MSKEPGQVAIDAWCEYHGIRPIMRVSAGGFGVAMAAVEAAVRAAAMEEAAKIIERRAIERHGYDKHGDADAIRAAKEGA